MDNFDEKLKHLLQNPEALAQVAQLAKGLGYAQNNSEPAAGLPVDGAAEDRGGIDSNILGALGGLDAKTLSRVAGLLGGMNAGDDRRLQLLSALRPYVRRGRQDKMDRAIQLIQLSKVAKNAMGLFGQ